MDTPTTTRLDPEHLLYLVAEATSAQTGDEFFRVLMRRLATALNVRCSFITECLQQPPRAVRTLAYWDHGSFQDNLSYDLIDTPCAKVISMGTHSLIPQDLGAHYACEIGFADSYLGVPIFDASGQMVIGHMAFLDDRPMANDLLAYAVFDIFAARAGAELQRRRTEEALRASEEKYRLLIEHQSDMVVQLDPTGCLRFVSPSYCNIFNYNAKGKLFIDNVPEDNRDIAAAAIQSLFSPPYAVTFEHRAYTRHGYAWFSWSFNTVRNPRGDVIEIVGIGRDVTQRRRTEEQTRQNLQELAHAARLSALGEMASALAHELNQPLAAILSFSQACQRQLINDTVAIAPEINHALERVVVNAQRAGSIIRHMRNFVRKVPLQRSATDIHQLIAVVVELVEPELLQQKIILRQNFDTGLPPVAVDHIQIQQVIMNLVRNSMEALAEDTIQERIIVIKTERITPVMLKLTVRDTGPGLATHIAARLFEPFASTKVEGLGIGLVICRSIIDSHGGNLDTEAAESGATFFFTLPLVVEGNDNEA